MITTAHTAEFAQMDALAARAVENRIRNIFTVEIFRAGASFWEEVAEVGALRTYEAAEAVAARFVGGATRARINVRPNRHFALTVAEIVGA